MESISRDFPRFLLNLGGFSSVTFTQFDYVQKTLLEELQATPNGLPLAQMKEITY